MTALTFAVFLALLATVAVFISGIASMIHGGSQDEKYSTPLMAARVALQGLAVVLILIALFYSTI